jgi:S-adenosylmethionine:tRNA ribosyltransferase-isomerase
MLKLSDFDYCLPRELIAQYPLKKRDNARLMILDRKRNTIEHVIFKDLPRYLKSRDLLILNDTKVLRCRLKGKRATGGRVEVLLLNKKTLAPKAGYSFRALIKPNRIKIDEKINFNGGGLIGIVSAKNEITFTVSSIESVYRFGCMPLPPYIKREPDELDNDYYQTVYAKNEGAVAAPTAGLHFTQGLIRKAISLGINISYVTLHVGSGTFKPVYAEDITRHKMQEEYFCIGQEAKEAIEKARVQKARIVAGGTTSLRAIETYAISDKQEGFTDLFIYPGFNFRLTDCLLTNFHLPRTTLFMLVCAFAGREFTHHAYAQAIKERYRFYSYGDAMLIM